VERVQLLRRLIISQQEASTSYALHKLWSARTPPLPCAKEGGLLVAVSTNVAIISGFVGSSIVSLIVIAAYGGKASDGVSRICFGIGCVVSSSC
jgi:hypothetical protein